MSILLTKKDEEPITEIKTGDKFVVRKDVVIVIQLYHMCMFYNDSSRSPPCARGFCLGLNSPSRSDPVGFRYVTS